MMEQVSNYEKLAEKAFNIIKITNAHSDDVRNFLDNAKFELESLSVEQDLLYKDIKRYGMVEALQINGKVLIVRSVLAEYFAHTVIALFEFECDRDELSKRIEKLITAYQNRMEDAVIALNTDKNDKLDTEIAKIKAYVHLLQELRVITV